MSNLASIYQASDAKIRAVWDFETSALFSPAERAALRLGYHAALVPNEASEADFADLKKHFDEGQIVAVSGGVDRLDVDAFRRGPRFA